MSKYLEKARELREDREVHYNCAQSVLIPFAEELGLDFAEAKAVAGAFGGGMRIGSVCGAVTGALMVLGLAGLDSPEEVGAFFSRFEGEQGGLRDCTSLVKKNQEAGKEKKPFCDGLVYRCVELAEEILRKAGKL